ncbi:hypothetical protein NKR19_g5019 [Coniochaeta hoffmannii]|uniref:Uncharacterized protein n=1 Tax=Coniochaeta hoffmannii TaxID=91930 RepID=A0AA38VHB0_9PEZI|nr:hypothetical protein NKR19_g5019 [Coniochaeta hoffmannii]
MPSLFTRYLLFPSPPSSPSSQMWDRPGTNNPIFASTRASRPDSMMWSRPGNSVPIYEEAVPTPAKTQMWRRSGVAAVPMCPCCTGETTTRHEEDGWGMNESRPGSMETVTSLESSVAARESRQGGRRSSGGGSGQRGLGLRLRKSFASLRSRASRSTMRE